MACADSASSPASASRFTCSASVASARDVAQAQVDQGLLAVAVPLPEQAPVPASVDARVYPKIVITTPWFALIFLGVAGFNTLDLLPAAWVAQLVALDKWILTMAMTALGMGTVFSKVKDLGPRPFMLALVLFAWLVGAGLLGTSLLF